MQSTQDQEPAGEPPRLRVLVLGRMALELDGRPHDLPKGQPARALLAWLALHPGTHEREHIADALWPGGLPKARRDSLKTALAKVRKVLPADAFHACVTVSRGELGLNPECVDTDLGELRRLLAHDRPDDALRLIRGELLSGIGMEWIDDPRHREHAVHIELLARLTAAAASRGDYPRAVRLAQRRVELDPFDESASLALITALGHAGLRRAGAEESERFRRARARAGLDTKRSFAVDRALADLTATAAVAPAGPDAATDVAVLHGYRWDGHLCRPDPDDPYRDFAVLHARASCRAATIPATLHMASVSADHPWVLGEGDRPPGLILLTIVDAGLDPCDERVFAIEEILIDGTPLQKSGVEELRMSGGRGVVHSFSAPVQVASGPQTIDVIVRRRLRIGDDRRVLVDVNVPQSVTDAEFRLSVGENLGARRISVLTSRIAPLEDPGTAVCGSLFGGDSAHSAAIARFSFPLQDGSGVQFEIERDTAPPVTRIQDRPPRTRPVGRTRRRA